MEPGTCVCLLPSSSLLFVSCILLRSARLSSFFCLLYSHIPHRAQYQWPSPVSNTCRIANRRVLENIQQGACPWRQNLAIFKLQRTRSFFLCVPSSSSMIVSRSSARLTPHAASGLRLSCSCRYGCRYFFDPYRSEHDDLVFLPLHVLIIASNSF